MHNPSEGIVTGSSDGCLILWNVFSRTKVSTYEKGFVRLSSVMGRLSSNPNGITACAYSYDGSMIVYATGYGWELVRFEEDSLRVGSALHDRQGLQDGHDNTPLRAHARDHRQQRQEGLGSVPKVLCLLE